MKLILLKNTNAIPGAKLLRLAGFIYIIDRKYGKDSYSRPLGRYHYPRFHVYLEESDQALIINIHLDQKQAIYVGVKRHSGEYDGPAVEGELARLRALAIASGYRIDRQVVIDKAKLKQSTDTSQARPRQLLSGDYRLSADRFQIKKSWWQRFFS